VTRRLSLEATLVGLVLTAPAFVWAALDRSIWPWDPAWYGEVSIDLYSALRLHDGWLTSMLKAFGQKAPGVAWLGQLFVPIGGLVGSELRGLLVSIVLTQAATIALVYAAARRASPHGRAPALAAALLLAGAPLFVGLSHHYFAEPLQGVAVAWVLFVMVSANRWRPALAASQLAGALALGLLAKVSTPAYVAVPALVAGALSIAAARHEPTERIAWYRDRAVLLSIAVAAAPVVGAAAWYERNGRTALDHARFAAGSELYGGGGSFGAKLSRWIDHLRDALADRPFDILLGMLLLAAAALAVVRHRDAFARSPRWTYAAACATSLVILLALFARSANEDIRFLLAALPHAALLLALALSWRGARWLALAAAALLAAQFAVVNARVLGIGDSSHYTYLEQPQRDASPRRQLEQIVDLTCNDRSNGRINVVGGDYPWLNGNTLSLLADARYTIGGRECEYTTLGYIETDPDKAWERVRSLDAPYYVSLDYGDSRNRLPPELAANLSAYAPVNAVDEAVFRRALDSGEYRPIPSTRRGGFVVLERTA